MSNRLPTVTIIVPARPDAGQPLATQAIRKLDYPASQLELIVARGKQPAVQRNTAIKAARGELLYFLDDDSRPASDALRRAAGHFAKPEVKMAGGPNVCPEDAPWIEQLFAVVLSSWLAFGPSRARYTAVGTARESSEKELILCNLIARRDTLLELGGFDESLYPNEENALMDEIQKRGGKLIYDPEIVVERRPRPTLRAFMRMLLNYGRGRAEQFRLHPTWGSALNFVPPLFCLYLILLVIACAVALARELKPAVVLASLPSVAYLIALLFDALRSAATRGLARSLAAVPLVIVTHVFYGLGFWKGLFTRPARKAAAQPVEVVLEHVTL
ncbi:MAG: glycosyltransferase [Verrucomicrobia subdivision 3 bacterium]|nr:glycosyltransferase [Limisphaerales bacterium]